MKCRLQNPPIRARDLIADLSRTEEGFETVTLNLDEIAARRDDWGLFSDRCPDLFGALTQ